MRLNKRIRTLLSQAIGERWQLSGTNLDRVYFRLQTDSPQRANYLMSLSILPIRSTCSGQLWHTLREESEKLFAPRTRAAESMSNHAAFASCCTERYFSMCSLLNKFISLPTQQGHCLQQAAGSMSHNTHP